MKHILAVALLFVFSSGAIAVAQNPGKNVFASKCAICHGPDGKGNTPIGKSLKIADLRSEAVEKMPDADLKNVITNGKNKMPAFKGKLTDAQIDQVISYIRGLQK
jgi:cytochrome c6